MDSALRDATPVHSVQRHLKELEHHLLALEQEPHGPEEPSTSDSEALSDYDDECYEIAGPCLAMRPVLQQKVKHKQPVAQGRGVWGPVRNDDLLNFRVVSKKSILSYLKRLFQCSSLF